MKTEYHIVYADDFVQLSDDQTPTSFEDPKDAYFHLAYMENEDELTVIRVDEDGSIYHQSAQDWVKIC